MKSEKTDSWEMYKRIFFSQKFSEALQEWKKKTGKNQEDFAEAIDGNRNSITKWKSGTDYPSQNNIKKICDTLGVDDTYFSPQSRRELYQYSPEYQDELSQGLRKKASDIGLNLEFLRAIKDITPFSEEYPLYSYITDNSLKRSETGGYIYAPEPHDAERTALAEAAPATDSLFQVEHNGNIHTLNCEDLSFLKQVQDKVSEYVGFLFYQRERELREELTEANKQFHNRNNIGGNNNGGNS